MEPDELNLDDIDDLLAQLAAIATLELLARVLVPAAGLWGS